MSYSPGVAAHLLALADDEHMVGARHTAWIGLGPFLEEDLAFCSIAQDELGHAIALYERILADPSELDRFALLRPATDYRSCWLAEVECSDWNDALVRHWLYDRAEALRWQALADGNDPELAAIARRAEREESFHRSHADRFMDRMTAGEGPAGLAARAVLTSSIGRLLPLALGLWDPVADEAEALAEGITSRSSADLSEQWKAAIIADLDRWGLETPWPAQAPKQNHRTSRSPGFDEFLAGLQDVIAIDPMAIW